MNLPYKGLRILPILPSLVFLHFPILGVECLNVCNNIRKNEMANLDCEKQKAKTKPTYQVTEITIAGTLCMRLITCWCCWC